MKRLATIALIAGLLGACGGSTHSGSPAPTVAPSSTTAPDTTTAPAATTTTTAPGPTSAQLTGELLSVSDLPTGWVSTPVSTSSSGSFCGIGNDVKADESGRAEADFTEGTSPIFDEVLAGYSSSPAALFAKAINALNGCTSFKAEGSTYSLGRMSFPSFGSESGAYQASGTMQGVTVGYDLVAVMKGDRIVLILFADVGTPDVAQVESFARLALAKLP